MAEMSSPDYTLSSRKCCDFSNKVVKRKSSERIFDEKNIKDIKSTKESASVEDILSICSGAKPNFVNYFLQIQVRYFELGLKENCLFLFKYEGLLRKFQLIL